MYNYYAGLVTINSVFFCRKIVKRMFGVDLTTRVKAEDAAIPSLLQQCIAHIENCSKYQ